MDKVINYLFAGATVTGLLLVLLFIIDLFRKYGTFVGILSMFVFFIGSAVILMMFPE